MKSKAPILVTSAGGQTGSVGRTVVRGLLQRGLPVRAFVRKNDERAQSLRDMGAEVFVGDLLNPRDVTQAVKGVRRIYFSMSLNPSYADATILMAAAAKKEGGTEIFVNMSDYEQCYMTLETMSAPDAERIAVLGADVQWSPQQRAHWAGERALDWSGLPIVHIQAAMFVENPITLWVPAMTIKEDGTIRLPFGLGKTAPVATADVADVCIEVLADPAGHAGKSYELTGPERKDMYGFAEDYSAALGRKIEYLPTTMEEFRQRMRKLMPHIAEHPALHLENLCMQNGGDRYIAEVTQDVEKLLGRPATTFRKVIEKEAWRFERGTPNHLQHREVKDLNPTRVLQA
ncbi:MULTISPECIES: NAD(P)H-binding protein [unclassified Bradyrhizobium]|uniref:NAD(P)H-binding protein n=1 Tax=unclassified Bradyrhizobium TaxID=2631580 RepID=UPI00291633BA|nr:MULTISPECIES: NAD(P)H-binding protein [unclassified Bradyrhizobium]